MSDPYNRMVNMLSLPASPRVLRSPARPQEPVRPLRVHVSLGET